MASYQEILSQIEDLKAQAQEARKQEIAGALAEIKRLMAEFGISVEDIGGKSSKMRTRSVGTAKYRDPASGKTWTGRGRRPAWVVDLEAQGKSLESCKIA
ncbi:MAG: H-NS histone family protein [Pseudomonadota bacterium]